MEIAPSLEEKFQVLIARDEEIWYKRLHHLCTAMANSGINIIVTNGGHGSAAWSQEGSWFTESVPIQLKNAVGSEDAFLAGFISEFAETQNFSRALIWATACAASNARHKLPAAYP